MGELEGEGAVVGENDQPFAFLVEAAYVKEARKIGRHEVKHRAAVVRVRGGADKSRRFVNDQGHGRSGVQNPVAHLDHVRGLHLGGKIIALSPVDRHLAAEDQFLTASA